MTAKRKRALIFAIWITAFMATGVTLLLGGLLWDAPYKFVAPLFPMAPFIAFILCGFFVWVFAMEGGFDD